LYFFRFVCVHSRGGTGFAAKQWFAESVFLGGGCVRLAERLGQVELGVLLTQGK